MCAERARALERPIEIQHLGAVNHRRSDRICECASRLWRTGRGDHSSVAPGLPPLPAQSRARQTPILLLIFQIPEVGPSDEKYLRKLPTAFRVTLLRR